MSSGFASIQGALQYLLENEIEVSKLPCILANRIPTQFLGPAPKGRKKGAFSKSGFDIQRLGSKSHASAPQYSVFSCNASTGTSTLLPFEKGIPLMTTSWLQYRR